MKIRPVNVNTFRENVIFLRKDSEFCFFRWNWS